MATTNILHLSDLHFGDDHLVISGDLTFQGREQGYTELADWLTNKLFPATELTPRDCLLGVTLIDLLK